MKIYLTRDSVAAGDDIDAPHEKTITLDDGATIEDILVAITKLNYLASIAGGHATWTLSSRIPIAVFAQEWKEPKEVRTYPVNIKELDFQDGTLKLHFSYHAQLSPEVVLEVLQRLRLYAS
jgi:hypothetical protein